MSGDTYESRPHAIEAFYFQDMKVKPPSWFLDAFKVGDVAVVNNERDKYIVIYNKQRGEMRKAFEGDWICKNSEGTIFPLTNGEFNAAFKKQSRPA